MLTYKINYCSKLFHQNNFAQNHTVRKKYLQETPPRETFDVLQDIQNLNIKHVYGATAYISKGRYKQ